MLEFCSLKDRTARKEHTCSMCGYAIKIGEAYERYSGKYDGYFFDEKYCQDCETIIQEYTSLSYDCEYCEDDISQWLKDDFCSGCIHGWHTDDSLDDCENSIFHCPFILEKISCQNCGSDMRETK